MPFLNVLVALLMGTSHAHFEIAKRTGPAAPLRDPGNCFADKLPFFQNFSMSGGDASEKSSQMQNACSELKNDSWNQARGVGARLLDVYTGTILGVYGRAAGSFTTLDGSPAQRRYQAELDKIKKIVNPMIRIQKVYELAARTQGHYDDQSLGLHNAAAGVVVTSETASNLINSRVRDGTVGVCREMSALLQWSLQQVSRAPGSTSGALGPNDFSTSAFGAAAPDDSGKKWGGHAWVRINMPVQNSAGVLVDFRHFDLDTTYYPERFSPLFPRRAGASKESIATLRRQCAEIQVCLGKKAVYELNRTSRTTNPTAPARRSNSNR
jgi:hypothetical protein